MTSIGRPSIRTCGRYLSTGVSLCLAVGFVLGAAYAGAQSAIPIEPHTDAGSSMSGGDMSHMAGHMFLTSLRPMQPGDQQKADAVVAAAIKAMEPYRDYHKALADGYQIFLPNVPQAIYHFSRRDYAIAARWQFDPIPTHFTAVYQDSRRRLQTGWSHVYGSSRCHRG